MKLWLNENLFNFKRKQILQTHGIAIGTKMAVAFSVIFVAHGETQLHSYPALTNLSPGEGSLVTLSEWGPEANQKSSISLILLADSMPQ